MLFYNFRDCFLMKSAVPTSALIEADYSSDTLTVVHEQLKEKFKFYPLIKHVHLHAITLFEVNLCFIKRSTMYVKHTNIYAYARIPFIRLISFQDDKQQPKGPINQYNFFSMESRKAIRQGNQSDEVSQAKTTI